MSFTELATLSFEHHLEKSLHCVDVDSEEIKFLLEHFENMSEDLTKLCFPLCYKFAALLDVLPDRGQNKFRVNRAITFDQCLTKGSRNKLSTRIHHMHVLPLNDIVDMSGDGGICTDAILLHLRNQLSLRQIPRCCSLHCCHIKLSLPCPLQS